MELSDLELVRKKIREQVPERLFIQLLKLELDVFAWMAPRQHD